MNKNVHNLIIAACATGVLAWAAPAQAIGYGFSRVVDTTSMSLETCYNNMVEGADGLEPHSKVCADLIGESFRDAFEDNFPTVSITGALTGGGVGVSVSEDGEIRELSGAHETGYDPSDARFDSAIGTAAMATTMSEDYHFFFNPSDAINSCYEYAVTQSWDYFTFRAHVPESRSAMELFEVGMTEAGGNVVNRLADGELLRNRAYHGEAPSGSWCEGASACLRAEDWIRGAFIPELHAAAYGMTIYRNAFHILNEDEMIALLARDGALAFALAESMTQRFENSWAQHVERYEELRDEDPEVLSAHYHAREDFLALVTQRRALAERIMVRNINQNLGSNTLSSAAVASSSVFETQLSAIDDAIAEALRVAEVNGCIGDIGRNARQMARNGGRANAFTACDWAPNDFIARFTAAAEAQVTERFEECVGSPIGARLNVLSTGHATHTYEDCHAGRVRSVTLSDNVFLDEHRVRNALATLEAAEERVLNCEVEDAVAASGAERMRLNYMSGESRSFGDSAWFAAGYEWGYDVGIAESDDDPLCNINPHVEAEVRAYYEIRNRGQRDIASAEIDMNARRNARSLDIEIDGHDMVQLADESNGTRAPTDNASYAWTVIDSAEQSVELMDFNFSVPGVPANIGVGATAAVGYEGTLEASFAEMTELGSSVEDDCMVYGGSITGGIRPYANAKAHVSAAFGFDKWGVTMEGGIQANVLLVEAALPVYTGLTLDAATDLSDVEFGMDFDVDFELSSLDGNVVAYAEGGVGAWSKRWEKELFEFNGFTQTFPLIDVHTSLDFEVWDGVCGIIDCVE